MFGDENAKALFGDADPSRYGTSNIGLKAVSDTVTNLAQGNFKDAALDSLKVVMPWGGNQLARTIEGVETVAKGGEKNASGALKYSVDNTGAAGIRNYIQGGLFGKWALPDAREYIDRGFTPMYGATKTEAREKALKSGMSADAFDEYFSKLKETGDSQVEALYALNSTKLSDAQKEMLWSATNNDWGITYKEFADKNAGALSSGLTLSTVQAYKEKFKNITGDDSSDKKREAILNDNSLTASQKLALDNLIIGQSAIDYTDKDTFRLSQMSESAQYRYGLAKEWGLNAEQYMDYYNAFYAGKNTRKDVGIQNLMNAGMSEAQAYYFYKNVLKADAAGGTETENKKKAGLAWGLSEIQWKQYWEAYATYGTKAQKIQTLMSAGMTQQQAEYFYKLMQNS